MWESCSWFRSMPYQLCFMHLEFSHIDDLGMTFESRISLRGTNDLSK